MMTNAQAAICFFPSFSPYTMSQQPLSSILAPVFSIFSYSQIESLLYAFLPIRLERHKTGIYAIDTFVVTASVTLLLVIIKLVSKSIDTLVHGQHKVNTRNEISVIIEPTHYDDYHSSMCIKKKTSFLVLIFIAAPNIYHQALSRLISIHAQENKNGVYKLKPNMEVDHEDSEPPAFNMIPQPDQSKLDKQKCYYNLIYLCSPYNLS